MSQVRVIARVVAQPGREEEVRTLLCGMLAPTRREEGCIFYDLYEAQQPGTFYFHELWETQATLDAHAASPHFQELAAKLPALIAVPLEVSLVQPREPLAEA